MIFVPFLGFLSFFTHAANQKDIPLVSATNLSYLSCTYWDGRTFTEPASR